MALSVPQENGPTWLPSPFRKAGAHQKQLGPHSSAGGSSERQRPFEYGIPFQADIDPDQKQASGEA
jgi:hypothetical protein